MSRSTPIDGPAHRRLGRLVRTLRAQRSLSQDRFASKCGMQRSYINAIETGNRAIRLRTLARMAAGLGISSSVFVDAYLGAAASNHPPFRRRAPESAAAMGRMLRARRKEHGASASVLAAACDIHFNYVTTIERGAISSPELATIARLAYPLAATDTEYRDLLVRVVRVYAGELRPPRAVPVRATPGLPPLRPWKAA